VEIPPEDVPIEVPFDNPFADPNFPFGN
jgi:hypothetical protein